jgi:hypothetical protein
MASLPLSGAETRIVSDDPAKGLGRAEPEALLPYKLKQAIGEPTCEVNLVSPYFVPTAAGVASFTALAVKGGQTRGAHQFPGSYGCRAGPFRICEMAQTPSQGRCQALRITTADAASPGASPATAGHQAVPIQACMQRHSRWINRECS